MNIGGKKVPPWLLWGGGIGIGLVGYIYLKNRGSSSASSSGTAAGTVSDPSTGQTYPANSVDSLTGMTYGAEIASYGSVAAAESAVGAGSSYGLAGGYGYGYGGTAGYPTSNVGTTSTAAGYSTNAQWAQAVQAGLSGLGYDSQTVAAALGLYLTNMPLNATDASIIQAAVAEYGPPPVGSYAIVQQGNGTGTTTATISVPNVVGLEQVQAFQVIQSEGLKPAGTPVIHGKILTVNSQSPKAGTHVAPGSTVTVSSTVHK